MTLLGPFCPQGINAPGVTVPKEGGRTKRAGEGSFLDGMRSAQWSASVEFGKISLGMQASVHSRFRRRDLSENIVPPLCNNLHLYTLIDFATSSATLSFNSQQRENQKQHITKFNQAPSSSTPTSHIPT